MNASPHGDASRSSQRVSFSADVEVESLERERRSCSHSVAGSSASEAPETINLDFGLLRNNHIYEACAAELRAGATVSDIECCNPQVHVTVRDSAGGPQLMVRLCAKTHGPMHEHLAMLLHDGPSTQDLVVAVSANVMAELQGTPVLRANVACLGAFQGSPATQDSDV